MATKKERSATFMWEVMEKLKNPPMMWNIIPFHPHEPNNRSTNRTPNKRDYEISKPIIDLFFDSFKFKRYFAVGRIAEKYLTKMGYDVTYIIHPSHGGSTLFKEGMYEYFEVKK